MSIEEKINYCKKNIQLKAKRLLRYNALDMFDAVEIETSTECNRACSNCPNSLFKRKKGLMEIGLFKKIINELNEIGFCGRFSPHFYNEPLLDKRLPLLINYARSKLPDANICIYTNGDLLNRKLFEELIGAGTNSFFVTQYDKTLSSNLKELVDSLNGKERKKITIRFFDENSEIVFNRGGLLKTKSNKFFSCSYPSTNLVVNWKGEVVLCCNDFFSRSIFGDLKKEKLMDVWKKEKFKHIRKETKKGIFNLDVCKKCSGAGAK